MDLPTPPQAVATLTKLIRDTLAPLMARRDARDQLPEQVPADRSLLDVARQFAVVLVGATAPFATTSYSRARLIRQMHASGLLTDEHLRRTRDLLELAADTPGS